ncbi:MAG: aldolase [Methanotrichaceae archaeon]|nr:aldolase [Methanotrichaceae archaeon]
MIQDLWQEMAILGKKIVQSGLTTSRFGNMSILFGEKILITKTGSMLDEIDENQIIEVDLSGPCSRDEQASTETCVHRAIYMDTDAQAIIHTHSPYAVTLSLLEDKSVEPLDSEGRHFLGTIPIVNGSFGTEELALNVCMVLKASKSCIARGHGVFALGNNLKEAFEVVSMVEHSAKIKYLIEIHEHQHFGKNRISSL